MFNNHIVKEIVPQEGEIFKETDFKGYFVSNFGRAYSYIPHCQKKYPEYCIVGQGENKRGYKILLLNKKYYGKKTYLLHRVIYATFHNIPMKDFINVGTIDHVDGNKQNNRLDNLEYVKQEENSLRAWHRQHLHDGKYYAVNQYDFDGHYLGTYKSSSYAARALGEMGEKITVTALSINQVCRQYRWRKSAKGYQWRYVKDVPEQQDIAPIDGSKIPKYGRYIVRYDKEGNRLDRWESSKQAAKALGIGYRGITSCARGQAKQAYGFVWKYERRM